MSIYKNIAVMALAVAIATPSAGLAQKQKQKAPAKAPVAAQQQPVVAPVPGSGPKVHTTETKDKTMCKDITSGSGLGGLAGLVVGQKTGSTYGMMAGTVGGMVVEQQIVSADKCNPRANVEGNAADPQPEKKKGIKLPKVKLPF